jgi:hypothetical protein
MTRASVAGDHRRASVQPVSTGDDNLYRGDPPPAAPPPPSPPPGFTPPYSPPPGNPQPPYPPGPYGPPPYGAPGYYGQPPGYPPMVYRRPTNTMAILALVLAFVFAPAGIVLGFIARKQISQTGEEGDGLALAGIIVGSIACAIWVLVIIIWIVAFASLTGSLN